MVLAASLLLVALRPAVPQQKQPRAPGVPPFERPADLRSLAALWAERLVALGMWVRTRRSTPPPPQRFLDASEQAILAAGPDTTEQELTRLRDGLEADDPLRLAAAYALAWLDLGYQPSRAVLLEYADAAEHKPGAEAEPESAIDWQLLRERQEHWRGIGEAEAGRAGTGPGLAGYALIAPEDMPYMLYRLWERRCDAVLMGRLLLARFDGAGADAQAAVWRDLLAGHPRNLLQALVPLDDEVWRRVASQVRYRMDHDAETVAAAFPGAYAIAADPEDSLRPAAQRMLDLIAHSK
jgi:hypothetical protein